MVDWITSVMERLGYLGVAFLMLAENLFPPIPSEAVMPLAGFTAASGRLDFTTVVLAGSAGSLIGALAWYYVGRAFGLDRLRRFAGQRGRWFGISAGDIDRSVAWFEAHGRTAVLVGRLIPGVRTFISVPAGICGMPVLPFLIYSAVGTLAWTLLLAWIGYQLREQWHRVNDYLGPVGGIVLVAIAVVVVLRLLYNRRRLGRGDKI